MVAVGDILRAFIRFLDRLGKVRGEGGGRLRAQAK